MNKQCFERKQCRNWSTCGLSGYLVGFSTLNDPAREPRGFEDILKSEPLHCGSLHRGSTSSSGFLQHHKARLADESWQRLAEHAETIAADSARDTPRGTQSPTGWRSWAEANCDDAHVVRSMTPQRFIDLFVGKEADSQ